MPVPASASSTPPSAEHSPRPRTAGAAPAAPRSRAGLRASGPWGRRSGEGSVTTGPCQPSLSRASDRGGAREHLRSPSSWESPGERRGRLPSPHAPHAPLPSSSPARSRPSPRPSRPPRPPPAGTRVLKDLAYVEGGHERQKLDLYLPPSGSRWPLVHLGPRRRLPHGQQGCRAGSLGGGVRGPRPRRRGHQLPPEPARDVPGADRGLQGRRALAARPRGRIPPRPEPVRRLGQLGGRPSGRDARHDGRREGSSTWADISISPAACRRSWITSGRPTSCRWTRTGCPRQLHDPADSPESLLIGGAIQENRDKTARANPITYVTKDDPPFLICPRGRRPAGAAPPERVTGGGAEGRRAGAARDDRGRPPRRRHRGRGASTGRWRS